MGYKSDKVEFNKEVFVQNVFKELKNKKINKYEKRSIIRDRLNFEIQQIKYNKLEKLIEDDSNNL